MFEYHGWITVRNSPGEEDDEGALPDSVRADVDAQLMELEDGTGLIHRQTVNGAAQIHLGGFLNHRAGQGNALIETFNHIAALAPGSYGMLYVWDDEDPDGSRNEFQAFVMRRGQVTRQTDSFLSPCIPVIEDEVL